MALNKDVYVREKKWDVSDLATGTGHARIKKLLKHYKQSKITDVTLAEAVADEMRERIQENHMSPVFAVSDILDYVKVKREKHPKRCETFLLEAVDIMVFRKVPSRDLLRSILNLLVERRGEIHREVILFEYFKLSAHLVPKSNKKLQKKQNYILQNVAGWNKVWKKPPSLSDPESEERKESEFYLELALRKNGCGSHSLMVEALYRLQNPVLVLTLLRCGVFPAAVFLWPITILVDRRLEMEEELHYFSFERQVIRYFCRARNSFDVHIIQGLVGVVGETIRGPEYDNVLLISQQAVHLIPEDRYLVPASLKHQCKVAIRDVLLKNDQLPFGIKEIRLPKSLEKYINLDYD